MKQRKKKFYNFLSVVTALASICCLGFVGWHYWKSAESEKKYENLRSYVEVSAEEMTEEDTPEIPEDVLTDAEQSKVDFKKLEEINPELYAWIKVPNTQIDYPIAQRDGEEQDFYLHHNMYQESEFAGCIYTENKNSKDFDDPVTVIYGHNMKNGSMFQNLFDFLDEQFFEENKYIYIYTPDKLRVYEIVSAFPYDDRNIMTSFDFSNEDELKKYLEVCQSPRSMEAMVRKDVKLDENSKIITLSTCIANQDDQRLLVQAVLMYEENEN